MSGTLNEDEDTEFRYYEETAHVLEETASQVSLMLSDLARRSPEFRMSDGYLAARILRLGLGFQPSKRVSSEAVEEYRSVLRVYPDLPLLPPMLASWYEEAQDGEDA
ncbi:hypothetical protein [Natronohydrobacter thiooxidans]|uniref:hypothetical protein n=1 Tax=Natronohydrobacter thiooxidans TaxID=87172 RepID=UPI0008FF3ADB|nr:hypothetical protein [Natronohydrobacter thiooxidans]